MTIAVDFDGVIHAYTKGWHDGTIYDPPLPGALDGLRELMARDSVFVFTTRDRHQVTDWLHGQDLPAIADSPVTARTFWNERGTLLVTDRKYPATAYLDDRAVRFTGWDQALADLRHAARPGPAAASARGVLTFAECRDAFAARIYEFWNPGLRWADAHPSDLTAYRADALPAMAAADELAGRTVTSPTRADLYEEVADRLALYAETQKDDAPVAARLADKVRSWAALPPAAGRATDLETTTRVFAALHRSAEQDVTRVIDLYEHWVKAGPPPLGTSVSRWWDARLVELHDAIRPPQQEQPESGTDRPGPRERHHAKWADLTHTQQAERIAALDIDHPTEQ